MTSRPWTLKGGGDSTLKEIEQAEGKVDGDQSDEDPLINSDKPTENQSSDTPVATTAAESVNQAVKKNTSKKKIALFGAILVFIVVLIAIFNGSSPRSLNLDSSTYTCGGVTLSYPSSWKVSSGDSGEISISSEDGLAKVTTNGYTSYALPSAGGTEDDRYQAYLAVMSVSNVDPGSPESLTVDGYPAYKLQYEEESSANSETVDITQLVVIVGNKINLITASCEKSSEKSSDSLTLSNILNSATVDVKEIKVTFKDGQGNEKEEVCLTHGTEGLIVAPTDFTMDGYIIDGWSCNKENVTVAQNATYGYIVSGLGEDTALDAVWAKGCTVTFEDGSGNVLGKQTIKQGSSATAPSTPTKTGCTFIGWDKDFSNVESDMTVVATWGYRSGSYRVGEDIPAGEYKLLASGSSYYCAYPDMTKSTILENGNFTTVAYVTLSDGQLFELNRGSFMPVSSASPTTTIKGNGIYKVGLDLPAGQYKLTQEGTYSAYYAVLSTVDATARHNIVDNDNFDNSSYVEVHDGQYLELSRCTASPIN